MHEWPYYVGGRVVCTGGRIAQNITKVAMLHRWSYCSGGRVAQVAISQVAISHTAISQVAISQVAMLQVAIMQVAILQVAILQVPAVLAAWPHVPCCKPCATFAPGRRRGRRNIRIRLQARTDPAARVPGVEGVVA